MSSRFKGKLSKIQKMLRSKKRGRFSDITTSDCEAITAEVSSNYKPMSVKVFWTNPNVMELVHAVNPEKPRRSCIMPDPTASPAVWAPFASGQDQPKATTYVPFSSKGYAIGNHGVTMEIEPWSANWELTDAQLCTGAEGYASARMQQTTARSGDIMIQRGPQVNPM